MTPLTQEQEERICYLIGEWYLEWRKELVNYENKTHRLGEAKENLKKILCFPVNFTDGEDE